MYGWLNQHKGFRNITKAVGIVLIPAAFVLFILRSSYFSETISIYRAESYIHQGQAKLRTTRGRLFDAPYALFSNGVSTSSSDDLGRARLILLNLSDSSRARHLQSLIDIGTRNWDRAADRLLELEKNSSDASIHNDLGVVFLQLADRDPIYLFKALEQFDNAIKAKPSSAEPHFNRLLLFKSLQLSQHQKKEEADYSRIEGKGSWRDELMPAAILGEDQVAAQLQAAIDHHDEQQALNVFLASPQICRTIAMKYAMNPIEAIESKEAATFVADVLRKQYGDDTVSSFLSALSGPDRSEIIEARRLVIEGAEYYKKGDLERSLASYDKASETLAESSSIADHLWIDVNRATSEIRREKYDTARESLERVMVISRNNNFKWLLATALAPFGALRILNSSFGEMMDRLEEAIRICDEIKEPKSSVKARFYMMGQRFIGGDLDGALKVAVESLKLADPSEHIWQAGLQSHISIILYKKGFIEQALAIGEESVSQAVETHIASLVIASSTSLGLISESNDQPLITDAFLKRSEEATKEIIDPTDRMRAEVSINTARARVYLNRGRLSEAEELLQKSRAVFGEATSWSYLAAQTWALLGQVYAEGNKTHEAQDAFQNALDIVEKDSYSQNEKFRVAFDDSRRELYDSAIAFEYGHGDTDAAWTYLQHYRAKLFIEILAQLNPGIERIHSIAIDRGQVQKAIPSDLQVVEYALLPDRLVIWLVTHKRFETRSVMIDRTDLEQKVQEFLANLRSEKPIDTKSSELYSILIAPIEGLLDPEKSLAIIPDRALHGLPFAAIECPENTFLIQKYPIIESPSLTHLLAANTAKPKRDAIVTFGAKSDVAGSREVGAMKAIYRKVTPFSGAEVTKAAFLDEMERASVFHYAGHSAHDAADPLRSSILLDGDQGGPNSVTAVDIVGHKLQPNALVVLSSCDSSIGNSKDGVGIRGLTSAFLIGGAGSVVGSLWPVESTSTSELMIGFHKAFAAEKLPVAKALRKAQLDFIATNPRRSHPYYWSGFVVTGNFSALR